MTDRTSPSLSHLPAVSHIKQRQLNDWQQLVTELQRSQAAYNNTRTMAPVGMVDMLGGFATPEVGIISLVVFLILSVTLLALCMRCQKNPGNAYDVNGTTVDGGGGTNDPSYSSWRDHKSMPPNTLERDTQLAN